MAGKKAASKDLFKPAATIIQSLLTDHRDDDFLPKPENLIRTTNLHRQNKRPKDPVDFDFTVSDYVPEGCPDRGKATPAICHRRAAEGPKEGKKMACGCHL